MIGSVIVMEPREFDDWLSGNTGNTTPVAAGQQLYQTLGCASCHGEKEGGGVVQSRRRLWQRTRSAKRAKGDG